MVYNVQGHASKVIVLPGRGWHRAIFTHCNRQANNGMDDDVLQSHAAQEPLPDKAQSDAAVLSRKRILPLGSEVLRPLEPSAKRKLGSPESDTRNRNEHVHGNVK